DGDTAGRDRAVDRGRRRWREPCRKCREPEERMRVEQNQKNLPRLAFHFVAGSTGDSTSPTNSTVPAMHPKTSFVGSSTGTSLATGLPFFVMTTGVRYFLTSSITRRQRALNSPAGIFFMDIPTWSWS